MQMNQSNESYITFRFRMVWLGEKPGEQSEPNEIASS
jgi:hypothetical protein